MGKSVAQNGAAIATVQLSEGWGRERVGSMQSRGLPSAGGLLNATAQRSLPDTNPPPCNQLLPHKAGNHLEEWDFYLDWMNFHS